MPMPLRLFLGFLIAALPLAAQAQKPEKEDEQKKTETGRHVRFLPVGDLPPFRQEIRDGVAYEIEPPAGSIPPREVILGTGDDSKQSAPLLLGQVTAPFKVPGGKGPLIVRRKGDDEKTVPWLQLERPETGDFMVLLWRDPVEKSWTATRSLVLPEDLESAPPGTVRFINLSPVTVGVVFGAEKLELQAGKSFRRKLEIGKDTPFELGANAVAGGLKRFYSGSLFQNPSERSLAIIYRADGVDPRLPLKAIVLREPVEPPVKPDQKKAQR